MAISTSDSSGRLSYPTKNLERLSKVIEQIMAVRRSLNGSDPKITAAANKLDILLQKKSSEFEQIKVQVIESIDYINELIEYFECSGKVNEIINGEIEKLRILLID